MRTRYAPWFLLVLLTMPDAAPAARSDSFLFERDVDVPSPGWVRVPLDLAAVRHLAPGGADLHVLAPGGGEVPARVEARVPQSERRPVQVAEVERVREGWTVLLDLGGAAVSHERLLFDMPSATEAPAVRLEGSHDRATWQTLTVGNLLQIGTGSDPERVALPYPGSNHRWLRLSWPREAGVPRVSAAEVEAVSGPALSFAAVGAPCREGGPLTAPANVCELSLPGVRQVVRRLTFDLEGGGGTVGYRINAPAGGAWRPFASGVWERTGEKTQQSLPGDPEPVDGGVLRLELYGEGGKVPRLVGYGVDLAVPTVSFRAEDAGRYTLVYGGALRRDGRFKSPAPGTEEIWLEAGPEREQEAAPLPGAPGAPLGTGRFAGAWRILSPTARPGDLVRLELPGVVYGVARPDLRDVRLAFRDLQVPFFRWVPQAPALAAEAREVHPRPLRRQRDSEAEIDLPLAGLPLVQLFVTAPGAGPLRRTVGIRYRPRSPVAARTREGRPLARASWDCDPEPPLPCRAELALPGEASKTVAVRIHDGDDPPLAGLAVEVWRRRDVLLFIWPAGAADGEVKLLAGAQDLKAPDYDFGALGPVLLAHPWHLVELDLDEDVAGSGAWWGRWVLPAALGIAALFLVSLLRRVLAEP